MINELIKLTTKEDGEKAVSARELYLGLGLNKTHWSRWYPTNIQNNEFFKENVDWIGFAIMENGNESSDFIISLEMAKHLAMMAKTKKSHEYRNYFINCEKHLIEMQTQEILKQSNETIEKLTRLLEESKLQLRPSHRRKLQYNKIIKQLAGTKDEEEAIKTFVLASLACETWEQTKIEDSPRIMELISVASALMSSKQFMQTKLF